jgi:CheY-like chemotaxis protein
MTGPQLTKRLRGDCGLTAPLILVSAHAGDQLHGLGGNPNHDGFIAKPVNIPALLDQVGELLHLSWTYDVAPAATDAPLWAPDEVLAALDEKLAIAHLRGLQAVLAGMDDSEPRTLSFRRRATVLVEAVDLEGLAVLIEETRHAA